MSLSAYKTIYSTLRLRSGWLLGFLLLILVNQGCVSSVGVKVNGKYNESPVVLEPGSRPLLTCAGDANTSLRLYDTDSGLTWYEGPAGKLNLSLWMIRPADINLTAEFAAEPGVEAITQRLVLRTDARKRVLYPGLEVRLRRGHDDLPLLPAAKAFEPKQPAVAAEPGTDEAYPGYRTAESVFQTGTRPEGKEEKEITWTWTGLNSAPARSPLFEKPDYWHMVLSQPSFSYDQDQRIAWRTAVVHPLGDLSGNGKAAADMRGLLMVETPGVYRFRIQSTLPARLSIQGQTVENAVSYTPDDKGTITPELFGADLVVSLKEGLADFSIILDRREEVPSALCVMWKPPGTDRFEILDGGRFLHAVVPEMEEAYQSFQKGSPWRTAVKVEAGPAMSAMSDRSDKSDEFGAWMTSLSLETAATNYTAFAAASQRLLAGWQTDSVYVGTPDVALKLMALTQARIDVLRKDPSQLIPGGFAKCHGDYLKHAEWLRGFLEIAMKHPELQEEALRTRADLHCYTALIHSRSFFSEEHYGTNDGYGDHNNFLLNVWRGASAWDDPVAYDMARSLCDNHFSYGWGTKQCMQSDGIFNFHAANGRHLNMGGYGHDWVTRLLTPLNFGTPWGTVPEQYRRLAEFTVNWEWFYYKGAMAFTTAGRHNSHQGVFGPGFTDRLLALPTGALDAETLSAVEKQKERLTHEQALEGNRFFFRHLQMIHRRADYYLDVKMTSPHVGGIETFASYQPGNLSFGDGVTTILRHGDEYRSIHAYNLPESLWRYRSLPGTTQLDYEYGDLSKWGGLDRYRGGDGSTAGGVSDGELGHCAFDFVSHKQNATHARKFFAFTEDGMVVLGAAIDGLKAAPLYPRYGYHSNLNQCEFKGNVTITDGTDATVINTNELGRVARFSLDRKYWIEHDGVGYLVWPTGSERGEGKPGELVVQTSMRTPVNRMQADVWEQPRMSSYLAQCEALLTNNPPRQTPVLEIWIDHGEYPTNATCAYFVCMRPEKRPAKDWLENPPVKILANTRALHAVEDLDGNVLHAFFREAGTLSDRGGKPLLTVDHPASVMLRHQPTGGTVITAQDPRAACTRDLAEMTDAITLTIDPGDKQRTLTLPMPGTGDPDDRYRGGRVQTRL